MGVALLRIELHLLLLLLTVSPYLSQTMFRKLVLILVSVAILLVCSHASARPAQTQVSSFKGSYYYALNNGTPVQWNGTISFNSAPCYEVMGMALGRDEKPVCTKYEAGTSLFSTQWRCTARQGGAFTSTQLFHTIAMEVRTSQRGPMYRAATAMRSTTFQHFRPAQPQHRWPLPLDLMRRTFASVRHTTRQRFTIMTDIEVENKFKPSCPEK